MAPPQRGRHRFGTPGLRHRQERPAFRTHRGGAAGRHRAPIRAGYRGAVGIAVALALVATLAAVTNWATTGTAFAGALGR
jgi:hypothetical protein